MMQYNEEMGWWEPAVPIGPQGPWAKAEFRLRATRRPRLIRLANWMGRIEEKGL